MGRTKMWIALAGVIVTLLGGVAVLVTTSGSGTKHLPQAATSASTETTVAASNPAAAPATTATTAAPQASKPVTPAATGKAPTTTVVMPSAAEIQKVLENIATQTQQAAAANPDKPMTKEQVEAQIRAQLKQLGINY